MERVIRNDRELMAMKKGRKEREQEGTKGTQTNKNNEKEGS